MVTERGRQSRPTQCRRQKGGRGGCRLRSLLATNKHRGAVQGPCSVTLYMRLALPAATLGSLDCQSASSISPRGGSARAYSHLVGHQQWARNPWSLFGDPSEPTRMLARTPDPVSLQLLLHVFISSWRTRPRRGGDAGNNNMTFGWHQHWEENHPCNVAWGRGHSLNARILLSSPCGDHDTAAPEAACGLWTRATVPRA